MFFNAIFLFFSFFFAISILSWSHVLNFNIFIVVIMCFVGHLMGTYFYSQVDSDSINYFFNLASPHFTSLGSSAVTNMVWYVRKYFTSDSIVSTFYFFTNFSFLGSVLWYLIYIKLIRKYLSFNPSEVLPAVLIMCWPSALFFTAGIGKDSLTFCFIPLLILSQFNIIEKNNLILNVFFYILSLGVLLLVRPYLLMILVISYFLTLIKKIKQLTFFRLMMLVLCLIAACIVSAWVLHIQGHLNKFSAKELIDASVIYQANLSQGTHFQLTSNIFVRMFLMPYALFMNFFCPLFFLVHSVQGYFASIENTVLLFIAVSLLRFRNVFFIIWTRLNELKFLTYFFLVGILFLSINNTNLGLAMRQKLMYLPIFLIFYSLVHALRSLKKKNLNL